MNKTFPTPILSINDYRYLKLVIYRRQDYSLDRDTVNMLQNKLEQAQIVEPEDVPANVVTVNSRVHLHDLGENKIVIRRLVYPSFCGDREINLSILSPWGLAILGRRAGEVVEWPLPWGYVRLKVLKISEPPKAKRRTAALAR